jgi:malate/lactate dehydrogenase
MSIVGCDVERRGTILGLKMNITGSFNKLLSDASMAIVGGAVERHRSMSRPSKDMLL